MNNDRIETIGDYLEKLHDYKDKSVLFRGVDHAFKMLPTIVRSFCRNQVIIRNGGVFDERRYERECENWMSGIVPSGNDELKSQFHRYEKELFKSFKRQARIYLSDAPRNDWEWLAVAQHYGSPTRFLDWTKNPLAAMFFSVSGDDDNEGGICIYALTFGELMTTSDMIDLDNPSPDDPLDLQTPLSLQRYIPPIIDSRMAVQASVFTILDPFTPLTKAAGDRLQNFVIQPSSRDHIRRELQRLGVNKAILFPDISNLAAYQRWVWEEYRNTLP